MATMTKFKTISEEHFAAYLDAAGHDWVYEPDIPGQKNKPDFAFTHSGVQVLCDVKQREANEKQKEAQRRVIEAIEAGEKPPSRARNFDPVAQTQHLAKKGWETFKNFDGHLCALVIFNYGNPDTRLNPMSIYGTILGVPGFRANISTDTGAVDIGSIESGYLEWEGDEARRYAALENISAVIALDLYRLPNPLFEEAFEEEAERRATQHGRLSTDEERFEIRYDLMECGMRASLGEKPGATVCMNPFAKIEFPDDLFKGPLDERWTVVDGHETRVFVGEQRLALEPPDDDDEV